MADSLSMVQTLKVYTVMAHMSLTYNLLVWSTFLHARSIKRVRAKVKYLKIYLIALGI